jgi:hypothetical protein
MLTSDDARLCTNYLVCKSYKQARQAGKKVCGGCAGDFSSHSKLTKILDKHLAPLSSAVNHNTPETMAERIVAAAIAIREEIAAEGLEVSPGEVGMLMQYRELQHVADLESIINRRFENITDLEAIVGYVRRGRKLEDDTPQ